jgi:hypothetical protein
MEPLAILTTTTVTNILIKCQHSIKRRKSLSTGHILHKNYLLKGIVEGKIQGTGSRGRRRKQLLDDVKETRLYWKLRTNQPANLRSN